MFRVVWHHWLMKEWEFCTAFSSKVNGYTFCTCLKVNLFPLCKAKYESMYPLCAGFYILQNLWTFSLVTLKTFLHPVVFHPLSEECISVLSAALSFQNISFWKYGGWSQIRKKTDESDKNVIHSFDAQLSDQLGHVYKSNQTHEIVCTVLLFWT